MRSSLVSILAVVAVGQTAFTANQSTDSKKAAVERAEAAVKKSPDDAKAHGELGAVRLAVRDNAGAITALTKALELDRKLAEAQDLRGDAHLKAGKFVEAVADYDAFLKVHPRFAPKHWRRGIALYYAGKHADGVKQFELHKTDNPEDVENAAWHYLCNVKVAGKDDARKALIAVTKDPRVPMAEIQKLFAGGLKPEDVLAAAAKTKADIPEGTSARFYGHLYVGLWYEAEGDAKKSAEHLTAAVEKYPVPDYMWDVGNAHVQALRAKKGK